VKSLITGVFLRVEIPVFTGYKCQDFDLILALVKTFKRQLFSNADILKIRI
jgi:hypothetical protein